MVAKDDLDDLKRLSPRERLIRLRELEEKRKQEITRAQEMMKESEREIEFEEGLKGVPIPQVKAVDIHSLFTPEEKEVFKVRRYAHETPRLEEEVPQKREVSLEEAVEEEAAQREITAAPQYGASLEEARQLVDTITSAYQSGAFKEIAGEVYSTGLSEKQAQELRERVENYEKALYAIQQAGVEPPEEFMGAKYEIEKLRDVAEKQLRGFSGLRYNT